MPCSHALFSRRRHSRSASADVDETLLLAGALLRPERPALLRPLASQLARCDSGLASSWSSSSACSIHHGSSHRVGAKSSACLSPSGQLSSDLSGCSTTSTSSMMPTPLFQSWSSATARAACCCSDALSIRSSVTLRGLRRITRRIFSPIELRFFGYCPVSSRCSSSSSLSKKAFTAAGVDSSTARSVTAARTLSSSSIVTEARRSKRNVHTGLCSGGAEKAERSVACEKRSSGVGTICVTSIEPSPMRRASIGAMTVVLPCPMMSWWQSERPAACASRNLRSSETCASRRSMPCVNS
mmetsp:Transcript_2086/g.6840  ORF Transcript_2086/g.6840 Transcript_2086/m.6840 type:complete len:298 (+) Transcript_2086:2735-3628(+)